MMAQVETLYGPIDAELFERAKQIRLLVCDVDGVLSDGRIYMGNQGEELKTFHTKDGFGLKALSDIGIEVGIITGRNSRIVSDRMAALGIDHVYQGQGDKLPALQDLLDLYRQLVELCQQEQRRLAAELTQLNQGKQGAKVYQLFT